jgi:hypothetical protein
MKIRWLPAIYFRGLVANEGPFLFEIRPYRAPKAALQAHRVLLRVYRHYDPAHCLAHYPFDSVRNAKAYAKAILRDPKPFLGKEVTA